jgi:hypothetical protein
VDQDSEIADLRRRAYSRSGTDDDLRRLAELERSPRAQQHVTATEPVVEPRRFASWRAAGLGVLAGASLATVVCVAAFPGGTREPEATDTPALAVFERPARAIDDPLNLTFSLEALFRDAGGSLLEDVDDVTLRWVGVAEGNEVYAARWSRGDSVAICLIVESTDQGAASCTPEADFIDRGIRMSVSGIEMKWGPIDTDVWVTTFR